jgi:hypothetical protein
MSGQDTFTDEDLTAYLDAEADPERARVIDEALAKDKVLQARLDRLSIPVGDLKTAFDKLTMAAPSYPSVLESYSPPERSFAGLLRPMAATAVLCLAAGWFAAGFYVRDKAGSWQQSVAAYHALYVNSTLSDVNQTPGAAAIELARVSTALGKPIALDAVTASGKLDYKRAQILGFEGRPLIQLAFMSKTGVPVALCIIRDGGLENIGIKTGTLAGMSTASWSKGDYDYLLIGGTDSLIIGETAAIFSAQL